MQILSHHGQATTSRLDRDSPSTTERVADDLTWSSGRVQ
jgi:hypothetical protein